MRKKVDTTFVAVAFGPAAPAMLAAQPSVIRTMKQVRMPEYDFHQKCYTCLHVVEGNRPVLFGYKDGGDIILHCGEGHDWESEPPKVVGIDHLIERDASIKEALSLKDGFEMERKFKEENWEIRSTPLMDE